MKQLFVFLFTLPFSTIVFSQNDKTPVKTPPKTTSNPVTTPALKTLYDSACYAVGVSVANFYKQQGIEKINTNLVSEAINDVLGGKPMQLDDKTVNAVLNAYMNKMQEEKIKPAVDLGTKFLATNKLRPEVKTTASGLQYEIIVEGTGPKPTINDRVTCHYKGMLLNGVEFDNSYNRGAPSTFSLNGVIAGWTEGLQLMNTGSKYKLYVPYNLGYGAYGYGSIPGGEMLIFEVELIAIPKDPSQ